MLKELYPEINTFDSFMLETNSEHRVYVERVGNSSGIPILFLHGGPGSGCNENQMDARTIIQRLIFLVILR